MKALIGILAMLFGVAALIAFNQPLTETKTVKVQMTAPLPDVKGTMGKNGKAILKQYAVMNGYVNVMLPKADTDYEHNNRCFWRNPDGTMLTPDELFVKDMIPPAGTVVNRFDQTTTELVVARPEGSWCEPWHDYGDEVGSPNVNLPNHDDDGEIWFCRHHRWC